MVKRIISLACLLLLICACAPVIAQKPTGGADERVSFRVLQQRPDAYRGRVVLLGGQILTLTVQGEETWVEVLEKRLDYRQRPEDGDQSAGRFYVRFSGDLDPAAYARGRKLTVVGRVDGKVVRPLNESDYTYPILTATEHYLWKPGDDYSAPRLGVGVSGHMGSGTSGSGGLGIGVRF